MTADGVSATVEAIRVVPGAARMWDLTVATVHTFAVGDAQAVVHNNCGDSAKVKFNDRGKIQHAYSRHGRDFGMNDNWSPAKGQEFVDTIKAHLEDADTFERPGTYRGKPATHFFNANTDLNVFTDEDGNFLGGWKLGPAQKWWVVMTGDLR